MFKLQWEREKFKLDEPMEFGVPLAPWTTFRVGGPADALARPRSIEELVRLIRFAHAESIPITILGGGANVVVSDAGIRGLVILTTGFDQIRREGNRLYVGAGTPISEASAFAAQHDLAGLSFIYAMPGTTGGAIWMNARCYDGEIASILREVRYLGIEADGEHKAGTGGTVTSAGAGADASNHGDAGAGASNHGDAVGVYRVVPEDFSYKVSPFQDGKRIILEGVFELSPSGGRDLWSEMRDHENDRRKKGHFDAPCAGSIFKNDRAFGEPSGRIIDRLGLRGTQVGGARVSDAHGNIIINTGTATAGDIRTLTELVRDHVANETGFTMEPEVLFIGDW